MANLTQRDVLAVRRAVKRSRAPIVPPDARRRIVTPSVGWRWAKVTELYRYSLYATLANSDGESFGDQFRVYVIAANIFSFTTQPDLTLCVPSIAVGDLIRVVRMPAAGEDYPAGWWMADMLFVTCYPEGGEDGGEGA